ncbi:von Willebrand factor D and EGF domain-containing protein-like [Ylistrum balloti]|uniref:von Willebrand factor D and EGF domain-containing protein-like n=1 Tax=Ylistrum balloti TaxID=509963 RepID=UPI002905AC94|nr:von Willebrand factor D and EGF domain-containing protein-like [Ylistrum balloti]
MAEISNHDTKTDPCLADNYVMMDDPTYFTTYETDPNSVRCETDIVKQWYRIKFGAVATSPPPLNRCGTEQTVWIDPLTLPSSGESGFVTLCLKTSTGDCPYTGTILAKNCGSFFVYELRQLNARFCPLGYCFEKDTGMIQPSVSASLVNGTITIDSTEYPNKEILFTCHLEANTDVELTSLYYDVVWYINDQEITRMSDLTYSTYINNGGLSEGEWRGKYSLPMQVKCVVQAKTEVSTGTDHFIDSAPFYAGFKTELSGETLQENGELNLTIRLTVPLGCTYLNNMEQKDIQKHEQDHCKMAIRVVIPDEDSATDSCTPGHVIKNSITFVNYNCGEFIHHSSWDTPVVLTLHGAPDNIVNTGHRFAVIQLRADSVFGHSVWSGAVGEQIVVHIHDDDINIMGKKCYSSNDPHMQTFDGKNYELQHTGEYVLYQHDDQSIAIHAYFQPCKWGLPNAKCNCGIAVRYSNVVFRANFCKHSNGYNRIIELNGCDKDAMKIHNFQSSTTYGSSFEITLQTGTVVTFSYGSFRDSVIFIHYIYVKPSMLDWKASRGLCGYLDGSTANDFIMKDGSETLNANDFSNSWKITSGSSESLFINPLQPNPTPSPMNHSYCTCKNESIFDEHVSCSAFPVKACSSSESSDSIVASLTGYIDMCRTSYTKRDTEEDMVFIPLYPNLEEGNDTESEVPEWSGNWTEISAAEACREFLSASKLAQKCEEVIPGFDTEAYVPDCTKDIKLTGGSTVFMESTLSLLQTACVTEAVRLENLTRDDSGNGTTLLDEILALRCTNNCSNAGSCVNGTCQCETGYEGHDCSQSGNDPPLISQETNMGLCDSSINTCSKYVVSGDNFMPKRPTCKVRPFKVIDSSIEMEGNELIFTGEYVNTFIVICDIPNSRKRRSTTDNQLPTGYKISLSNDGTTFSTEVTFINFDANCYECNITTMTCTAKGCSQSVQDDSSTIAQDNSSKTAVVMGVVVGLVSLLVIVVALCCIKKKFAKKQTAVISGDKSKSDDGKWNDWDLFNSSELIIGVRPPFQTCSKEKIDLNIYDMKKSPQPYANERNAETVMAWEEDAGLKN